MKIQSPLQTALRIFCHYADDLTIAFHAVSSVYEIIFMYVQITESISAETSDKLAAGCLTDADVRKVLLRFGKNGEV